MSDNTRVLVSGAQGRMGAEIISALSQLKGWQFSVGVDREGPSNLKNFSEVDPEKVDIVIDFSLPENFLSLAKWSHKNRKPFVSGTTGLKENDFAALRSASEEAAVLWAPNMSLGVNFLSEMLKSFKAFKDQYDFQIEEIHHIHKKDKPSGTAILLQESLVGAVGNKVPEPLSIRGGGVFGVHKVWAMSESETIQIEHTALNRKVFAEGAIFAAQWLIKQKPGLYTMKQALGL